jgi:DNA-binding PadR family transcriptional regulator
VSRSLGEFELLLLFAVLRLSPDEAYGARIAKEIEERTGREVSAGAVYTGLERLRSRGLVSSREGEATPVRGGRRKKYYRLEPDGATALHGSWTRVRSMADGVRAELERAAGVAGARESEA